MLPLNFYSPETSKISQRVTLDPLSAQRALANAPYSSTKMSLQIFRGTDIPWGYRKIQLCSRGYQKALKEGLVQQLGSLPP